MSYQYYICNENDELIFREVQGFTPKNAILRVNDKSLKDKALKLIDEPVLDLDGQPQLDIDGNPITKKVAVVDEATQAAYEAEQTSKAQEQAVYHAVQGAIGFGNKLMTDFIVENVKLGITADGMTETVLEAMSGVMNALQAGSLYLAIDRIKAIPEPSKDAKYITDVRLLDAVNKIEEYLGVTLSQSL